MHSKKYTELALRTDLSDEQYRTAETRFQTNDRAAIVLHALFHEGKLLGNMADDLKRAIFYGKGELGETGVFTGMKTSPEDYMALEATFKESPQHVRLLHAGLGKITEALEFFESVEKLFRAELDDMNLVEENGDSLWYDALAGDAIQKLTGVDLSEQMERNINKLKVRYPEKYLDELSAERNLEKERSAYSGHAMNIDGSSVASKQPSTSDILAGNGIKIEDE